MSPVQTVKAISMLVLLALVVSGCAPCRHYNRLEVATFYGQSPHPKKKRYGTVLPFQAPEDVKRPYEAIGWMSCEGKMSEEGGILNAMLYRAADMGADGIILNPEIRKISQEPIGSQNIQTINVGVRQGWVTSIGRNTFAFRAEAIRFTDTNSPPTTPGKK